MAGRALYRQGHINRHGRALRAQREPALTVNINRFKSSATDSMVRDVLAIALAWACHLNSALCLGRRFLTLFVSVLPGAGHRRFSRSDNYFDARGIRTRGHTARQRNTGTPFIAASPMSSGANLFGITLRSALVTAPVFAAINRQVS